MKGSCLCGSLSYTVAGHPVLSAYCHCTLCQRSSGGAFIWSLHYRSSAISWTYTPDNAPLHEPLSPDVFRYRCKSCGIITSTCNTKVEKWAVRGAQLERDEEGKIKNASIVKPTAHIFYGTRMLDVDDGLSKWEGFQDQSVRIS
ncbi:Mss4-like protein [Mycena sp. CBHHK59/15]|nr:Mss4-like protein [Mycena sp. CBHHK59/15]